MKKTVLITLAVLMSSMALAQGTSTNLELNVTKTEPVPLQAGEYADVWVRATNTGDATASNVEVELVDEFPFHTDDRKNTWEMGELRPGDTYQFRAKIRVNENAVFGENDLKFRRTSGNQDTWVTESIPVEVRTDDRSLVVENLDFPERVEPGSSAEMTMELRNLAESTFRNVDVSLDFSELPIAPRETSRKRISRVGPSESRNVSFTVDVDQDADNQLVHLPITIDYENQAGQEFTLSETTGVSIGGYPNVEVGIDSSDIRTPGKGQVTLRIINRGEGQARFAEVKMQETERYEILSEDSVYLGTMIADDYQTAEFDLYVEGEEDLQIPVTVDYRDGEGDKQETFMLERDMYSSSEAREYGLNQGGSLLPVAVVVLLLIAGGVYYWRKRRKE